MNTDVTIKLDDQTVTHAQVSVEDAADLRKDWIKELPYKAIVVIDSSAGNWCTSTATVYRNKKPVTVGTFKTFNYQK